MPRPFPAAARSLAGTARDGAALVTPVLRRAYALVVSVLPFVLVLGAPVLALWLLQGLFGATLAACEEDTVRWDVWLERLTPDTTTPSPGTTPATATTGGGQPPPSGLCLFVESVVPRGALTLPVWTVVLLALVLGALLVARWVSARLPYGPIRLTDVSVLDAGPGSAARGRALTSWISHHSALPEQSVPQVVPSYGGPTGATAQFDAAGAGAGMALVTRALTWLGAAFVRPGWRVDVEEVENRDRPTMSYRIVSVGRDRVEHGGVVTAADAESCAAQVGHAVAAWASSLPGRGRGPGLTAAYVGHLTAALSAARRRDYDQALHEARRAVRTGTTDLEARRVLGETQERLGLSLEALHTYAAALVLLRGDLNTWKSPYDPHGIGHRGRARSRGWWHGWESSDATGSAILWRYVMTLRMTSSWVDRFIAATCQLDPPSAHPHTDAVGEHPWFIGKLLVPVAPHGFREGTPASAGVDDAIALARRRRDEADAMIRALGGFFAHRYRDLLRREHPALARLWFVRSEARAAPFGTEDPPGTPTGPRPADRPRLLGTLLQSALHMPSRVRRGPGAPRLGHGTALPTTSGAVGHDLAEVLTGLHEIHRHVTVGVGCTCPQPLRAAVAEVVRSTLEFVPVAGVDLKALAEASLPGTTSPLWARGLTRPVLAQVVTRLVHQVTTEIDGVDTDAPSTACPGLMSLLDSHRHEFADLAAALDLHLFALRAALEETVAFVRRRSDARPQGTPALQQILWLTVRHQYLARLVRLRTCFLGPHAAGPDPAEIRRRRHQTQREVERTVHGALWWTRTRVRFHARRLLGLPEIAPWNVHYYAACAFGVMVDPAPEGLWTDPGTVRSAQRTAPVRRTGEQHRRYTTWCRTHDVTVELAVRHLSRFIPSGHGTGAEVPEWIVFDDPDLDQLRRHPRFRQWADTVLDVQVRDETSSPGMVCLGRRADQIWWRDHHYAALNPYGALGHDRPWGIRHRQWRLMHSHHLARLCDEHLPTARRRLAAHLPGPAGTDLRHDQGDLRVVLDAARRFWTALAAYPQVFPDPSVRRRITSALIDMAGAGRDEVAGFPRVHEALGSAIGLSTHDLSRETAASAPPALHRIHCLRDQLDGAVGHDGCPRPAELLRAVVHDLAAVPELLRRGTAEAPPQPPRQAHPVPPCGADS